MGQHVWRACQLWASLSASQVELAYNTAGTKVHKADLGWTRVCRQSTGDCRDSCRNTFAVYGATAGVCPLYSIVSGYFIQCLSTYCVSLTLVILCFVSLSHRQSSRPCNHCIGEGDLELLILLLQPLRAGVAGIGVPLLVASLCFYLKELYFLAV